MAVAAEAVLRWAALVAPGFIAEALALVPSVHGHETLLGEPLSSRSRRAKEHGHQIGGHFLSH